MEPGARVQVEWNDGKVYPGTVTGFHNGFYRVQWDGGTAFAWVPPAALRSGAAPPVAPSHAASMAPPPAPLPFVPAVAAAAPEPMVVAPAHAPAAAATGVRVDPIAAAERHGGKPFGPGVDELPRGFAYEPTGAGAGTGKAFHFLYGLSPILSSDRAMRQAELGQLGDDVAALRAAGYRVYVDLLADAEQLTRALRDEHPDGARAATAGIFWAGHGLPDGGLVDWEGRSFGPRHLTRVTAPPAHLKMLVMSACYVGATVDTWKKVVGDGVKILGWGAPVSAAKAAEFLRQDETTSKGFDDFLKSELGVTPVAKEGPLPEAVALGDALSKRLVGWTASFDRLVELASSHSVRPPVKMPNDGSYSFVVPLTVTRKDGTKQNRLQTVFVIPQGPDYLVVSSSVGPYSDLIDLAKGLRLLTQYTFTRLILVQSKDNATFMIVESACAMRGLRPTSLFNTVIGVGLMADSLEDMYFGADTR